MRESEVKFYPRERKKTSPIWYAKVPGVWKRLNTGVTTEKSARAWWRREVLGGRMSAERKPVPTLDKWADGFYGLDGRYDRTKQVRGQHLSQMYLENLDRHHRSIWLPCSALARLT